MSDPAWKPEWWKTGIDRKGRDRLWPLWLEEGATVVVTLDLRTSTLYARLNMRPETELRLFGPRGI